jgi:hypothetical protein
LKTQIQTIFLCNATRLIAERFVFCQMALRRGFAGEKNSENLQTTKANRELLEAALLNELAEF